MELRYTAEFKRNLRQLAKRYRRIQADIDPVLCQLENGETPGDRITGVGAPIFKVRVRNSDSQRGKSGGYRVIYYVQTRDQVTLVTIYSKSDQGDVTTAEVRRILAEG